NEHVVGTAPDALDTPQRAPAFAGIGDQGRNVARAIANHGHGLLAKRSQDQLAFVAIRTGLAGLQVNDLGIEIIFEDVGPSLALAFHGHPRADDFGQAVNVVGLDAAVRFDAAAHG